VHRYLAHGLVLASRLPIPALLPAAAGALTDVTIHFLDDDPPVRGIDPGAVWFESPFLTPSGRPAIRATRHHGSASLRLAFADGPTVDFDASGGTVQVRVAPGQTVAETASYLLGPVLGILLRLRGVLCLHASAVAIDGEGVAFVGPPGSGKSTLAAAFAAAGRDVLSDDTVALRPRDRRWFASSGYPRLRLWPDAAGALGVDDGGEGAASLNGSMRRHVDVQAAGRFRLTPVPLGAIYLLEFGDPGERLRVDAVLGAQAVTELAANTFAGRVLDRDQRGREFDALISLAGAVCVRRLRRPLALAALGDVVAAVEHDRGAAAVRAATGKPQ
jgi:hypothetical protein